MKRAFALALGLSFLLSFAALGDAAKRPGVGARPAVFQAKLHVAGGVTIRSTHDTLGECTPGQAWTMVEKADLVINDVVTVQRFGGIVTSTFARGPGAVDQKSLVRNYRTTNACPPDKPVKLVKPKCRSLTGTGLANLTPDPRRNGKVSLGITRKGGGRQDLSCFGPTTDSTPMGSAITALQSPFTPIALPLNLKVAQFKRLKAGQRLISRVEIAGRCKFAVAAPMRDVLRSPAADDACEVDGVFNVVVTRVRG